VANYEYAPLATVVTTRPPRAAPQIDRQGPVSRRRWLMLGLLAVWGPGLIVMLADTDAGCIITAAQSGAEWGYALVLPELVLIPILYMAQEMTVRLGVVTGKGHGQLIREHFGPRWATLSATTLMLSAVGALLTEFAGIAGVGELFGLSKWLTVPVATAFLVGLAFSRSYRRVERIGIAIGLAELTFVPAMLLTHPSIHQVLRGLGDLPLGHASYLTLLAANIGAVIMPWMIFYQQGAVIDKGLTPSDLHKERHDTAVGSVVTQGIMITVIVALAATVYRWHRGVALNTVAQIAGALSPDLGRGELAHLAHGAIACRARASRSRPPSSGTARRAWPARPKEAQSRTAMPWGRRSSRSPLALAQRTKLASEGCGARP
jgi:Mn2+/Fe2+ NRAMP family transporter